MMMGTVPVELGHDGVLAPGRWRWLRALGWMVAVLVAVILAWGVPIAALAAAGLGRTVAENAALLSDVLAILAYAAMVRWGERRVPGELSLRALPVDLIVGLLIGLGMFTLVFTSLRLVGVYTLAPGQWTDWFHDLWYTLSTGLHEELVARLIIFRLLMRAAGVWPALLVSALAFGAGHLANPNASWVAAFAIAVEAGLMLAAFYLLTGRIWMSVGVHAAWNLTQGSIFGARVSGLTESGSLFTSAPVPGSPDWLSGGAFGPEASVPAMVIGVAIFALLMARARRPAVPSDQPTDLIDQAS